MYRGAVSTEFKKRRDAGKTNQPKYKKTKRKIIKDYTGSAPPHVESIRARRKRIRGKSDPIDGFMDDGEVLKKQVKRHRLAYTVSCVLRALVYICIYIYICIYVYVYICIYKCVRAHHCGVILEGCVDCDQCVISL